MNLFHIKLAKAKTLINNKIEKARAKDDLALLVSAAIEPDEETIVVDVLD